MEVKEGKVCMRVESKHERSKGEDDRKRIKKKDEDWKILKKDKVKEKK